MYWYLTDLRGWQLLHPLFHELADIISNEQSKFDCSISIPLMSAFSSRRTWMLCAISSSVDGVDWYCTCWLLNDLNPKISFRGREIGPWSRRMTSVNVTRGSISGSKRRRIKKRKESPPGFPQKMIHWQYSWSTLLPIISALSKSRVVLSKLCPPWRNETYPIGRQILSVTGCSPMEKHLALLSAYVHVLMTLRDFHRWTINKLKFLIMLIDGWGTQLFHKYIYCKVSVLLRAFRGLVSQLFLGN